MKISTTIGLLAWAFTWYLVVSAPVPRTESSLRHNLAEMDEVTVVATFPTKKECDARRRAVANARCVASSPTPTYTVPR